MVRAESSPWYQWGQVKQLTPQAPQPLLYYVFAPHGLVLAYQEVIQLLLWYPQSPTHSNLLHPQNNPLVLVPKSFSWSSWGANLMSNVPAIKVNFLSNPLGAHVQLSSQIWQIWSGSMPDLFDTTKMSTLYCLSKIPALLAPPNTSFVSLNPLPNPPCVQRCAYFYHLAAPPCSHEHFNPLSGRGHRSCKLFAVNSIISWLPLRGAKVHYHPYCTIWLRTGHEPAEFCCLQYHWQLIRPLGVPLPHPVPHTDGHLVHLCNGIWRILGLLELPFSAYTCPIGQILADLVQHSSLWEPTLRRSLLFSLNFGNFFQNSTSASPSNEGTFTYTFWVECFLGYLKAYHPCHANPPPCCPQVKIPLNVLWET